MKKALTIIILAGMNLLVLASSKTKDAEKNFNKKLVYESKKVLKTYDSEIKRIAREGKLKQAEELKQKKELFIDKISAIVSSDKKVQLKAYVKGKRFIWGYGSIQHTLKFERTGKIEEYIHPNESFWDINEEGMVVIYNASKKAQWTFVKQEKRKGKWYFETDDGHYLLQK